MIKVIRLSCDDCSVELKFDTDAIYTSSDRTAWIAGDGAMAYRALFDQCGLTESTAAMLRRLIKEDGGKSPADQIAILERQAAALEGH